MGCGHRGTESPGSGASCAWLLRRSPPGVTVTRRKIRCPSLLRARRGRELLFARLLEQTVQVDLRGLLREVDALHPGVVEDVFEGRPVRGAQGQAPPDEVLALCGRENHHGGDVSSCPPPPSYAQNPAPILGASPRTARRVPPNPTAPQGGATSPPRAQEPVPTWRDPLPEVHLAL